MRRSAPLFFGRLPIARYFDATANEIVAQTQKMLEARPATASVPGSKRVNSFD